MLVYLVATAIAAYLFVGVAITIRAMNHVRAHALTDETYFIMSIQSAKPCLSMILPQVSVILAWPVFLILAKLASNQSADVATNAA